MSSRALPVPIASACPSTPPHHAPPQPEDLRAMKKIVVPFLLSSLLLAGWALAAPAARKAAPAEQRVSIEMTSKGFVPDTVLARVGQPLVLAVTRRTERTCATEIVIKEMKIHEPLPLGRTVEIRLTPSKRGALRFTCAMGMIAGVILVR